MDAMTQKYKKPYDPAYRRKRYLMARERILAKQREYDAAHREERKAAARARYAKKCDRERKGE